MKEQRKFVRHVCILAAEYFGTETHLEFQAQVLDISRGGIKLLVGESFGSGAVLRIRINKSDGPPLLKKVRVIHEAEQSGGLWLQGGAFQEPFSEKELVSAFGWACQSVRA